MKKVLNSILEKIRKIYKVHSQNKEFDKVYKFENAILAFLFVVMFVMNVTLTANISNTKAGMYNHKEVEIINIDDLTNKVLKVSNPEPVATSKPLEIVEEVTEPKKETKEEPKEETKEETKEVKTNNKTLTATVTHYCACKKCNGKYSHSENGINYTATASGIKLYDGIEGNYCAATFGKLGDIITIDGVEYKIVDRMGNRHKKGNRVDIFVSEGHSKCYELGKYTATVYI